MVGRGRTAEIFRWDEGNVLRLYREGASLGYVQRELRAFSAVSDAGVPSPTVYPADTEDGLLIAEERLGFVMEHIDGPTMLRQLIAQPWKLWDYARTQATLHHAMHQQSSTALPSQRERFHRVIDQLGDELPDNLLVKLHQNLDSLDDGTAICHGDFHPDNIILSGQGPVIIDWGPATAGAPAADVAWTVHLLKNGGCPPGMSWWQRFALTTLRQLFLTAYLRAYFRLSNVTRKDVANWKAVNAAIRLGDRIPEEREVLLKTLRALT